MSVVRIDIKPKSTHGYQARAPIYGKRCLSMFFSDREMGGATNALKAAKAAERALKRMAAKMRESAGVA